MWNIVLEHRRKLIIVVHIGIFAAAYFLAFGLRFDFDIPENYLEMMFISLPFVVLLKIVMFDLFALHQGWWRYVGINDLVSIIKASLISLITIMAVGYVIFHNYPLPRSIPILDFFMTVALVGGARFSIRAIREGRIISLPWREEEDSKRLLIIGAGDAGETLAREVDKHPEMNYSIVGFLDDSPFKRNVRIHGYRVIGKIDEIKEAAASYEVEEVVIAIPSLYGERLRRIVDLCEDTGLPVKIIPGIDRLIDGRMKVTQLREVGIEDLLGRDPVQLDKEAVGEYLGGKRVLVTGAAGSIGSEICRQVLAFKPSELILVDQWENGVFEMGRELISRGTETSLKYFIGDVADRNRMLSVFKQARPDVVFHAAAYKHVPLMEDNIGEAVKNNIGGTKTLADICDELGFVRRFVMISTDKAVNPTSVMGASKRIAERYVQHLAGSSKTKFITVRFGNVLGSAGSVIPIFKQQIANGGPVTVTHPDMMRYFMTIPEASQLVLQAGAMGKGGEIYVLDMGEPVKIVDLAKTLIKLSGFKPGEDVRIEFTGMRPGEKLFEELYLDEENITRTSHAKVHIAKACELFAEDFMDNLYTLVNSADDAAPAALRDMIGRMIPEFMGCEGSTARKKQAPSPTISQISGDKTDYSKIDEDNAKIIELKSKK